MEKFEAICLPAIVAGSQIASCMIKNAGCVQLVSWKIKDAILYHNFSDAIITNSQTAALKMATFEWTKVNANELITLYEERPCLYNKGIKEPRL